MNLILNKISLPCYDSLLTYLQGKSENLQGSVLVALISPKNEIYSSSRSALFLLFEDDRERTLAEIACQCQQFDLEEVEREPLRVYLATAILPRQQLEELLNSPELSGDALILREKFKAEVLQAGWW